MVSIYAAPGARLAGVLHIAEPGARLPAERGVEPLTACGVPMLADELWTWVDRRPGDHVCRACIGVYGEVIAALFGEVAEPEQLLLGPP